MAQVPRSQPMPSPPAFALPFFRCVSGPDQETGQPGTLCPLAPQTRRSLDCRLHDFHLDDGQVPGPTKTTRRRPPHRLRRKNEGIAYRATLIALSLCDVRLVVETSKVASPLRGLRLQNAWMYYTRDQTQTDLPMVQTVSGGPVLCPGNG
ncbi:unnamed protein product [Protopolystoma xenopodis]|uniref:Uncharacterized protein n=1 Tax=Protopolystoma xenopodis TaxID=117903 RepID=A0A448WZ28_9PLAT|nr:unnamed protein product [Protopolystoma xenopodis]